MDQFDIYVNVERPPANRGKKKSLVKCSGNIFEHEDHSLEPNTTEAALSGAEDGKKFNRSPCRAAAVFLGLLCLLLLIGLMTLVFLFTKNNSERETELVQLHTSYNNLTKERDQLQTSYSQLAREKDQLQERFEALTKDRDDLQTKLQGWVHFRGSFYHFSSSKKTWQQSRDDCLQKDADLLIINSKEEQDFTNQFKKYMWIGLTDSEREGTWKWVDGTPMTKSYWGSEEPNGKKSENCVDIKNYNAENSWNDEDCSTLLFWICEKKARF